MSQNQQPPNPAAFPVSYLCRDRGDEWTETNLGMSLRDYFAGQAATSMVAGPGAQMVANRDERYDGTNWAQVVAMNAYEMADAMLAERVKSADVAKPAKETK